jgi:hypothetical protein
MPDPGRWGGSWQALTGREHQTRIAVLTGPVASAQISNANRCVRVKTRMEPSIGRPLPIPTAGRRRVVPQHWEWKRRPSFGAAAGPATRSPCRPISLLAMCEMQGIWAFHPPRQRRK